MRRLPCRIHNHETGHQEAEIRYANPAQPVRYSEKVSTNREKRHDEHYYQGRAVTTYRRDHGEYGKQHHESADRDMHGRE